jgi:hypothetical protein
LRLFKCFNPNFCVEYEECLVLWAEDERAALQKCIDIHNELDIYPDPEEMILNHWEIEEYFVDSQCDVYVCIPHEMEFAFEVKIISVPFSVKDVEKYIMDKLADWESQEQYFIEHVLDKDIGFSFNERFYYLDGEYIFTYIPQTFDLVLRKDLRDYALQEYESIDDFIFDVWFSNVNTFFGDNEDYRDQFVNYITSDEKPEFDEGFFFYIAKKLINTGEWITYDIKKIC